MKKELMHGGLSQKRIRWQGILQTLNVIGQSPLFLESLEDLRRYAETDAPILITGSTGTGKEALFRAAHNQSLRADKPLVVINCTTLNALLAESTLFGHKKGAFTGAYEDHAGYFEQVQGGTVVLDEIGDLSPDLQAKFLRVIEEKTIRPLNKAEKKVDFRLIAATNRNLSKMVEDGKFRADLFARIYVCSVHLPLLKERKSDISLLAQHFLELYNQRYQRCGMFSINSLNAMLDYDWPLNIRELKNAIHRSVARLPDSHKHIIQPDELKLIMSNEQAIDEFGSLNSDDALTLEESEKKAIIKALNQTGGVQKEAAEVLGISRRAIHYKIKKFGINAGNIKAGASDAEKTDRTIGICQGSKNEAGDLERVEDHIPEKLQILKPILIMNPIIAR